jgi:hypothetical protein
VIRFLSGINEHQVSVYMNKHKIQLDFNHVLAVELWLRLNVSEERINH